jgi:hypothetical protein
MMHWLTFSRATCSGAPKADKELPVAVYLPQSYHWWCTGSRSTRGGASVAEQPVVVYLEQSYLWW